uniref:DUF4220 domain-containing protein n=1 Tax=Leersia perrieri TaxID=77586 RepID=A0A0D9XTE5_9ORYZ
MCFASPAGDNLLFMLIFVPAIYKCFEKPWALKTASINSLVNTAVKTYNDGEINSLDEYVQAAAQYFEDRRNGRRFEYEETPCHPKYCTCLHDLFVDLSLPYPHRLGNLKYLEERQGQAHRVMEGRLSMIFDRLYTASMFFRKDSFDRSLLVLLRRGHDVVNDNEAINTTDGQITVFLLTTTYLIENFGAMILLWYLLLQNRSIPKLLLTLARWYRDHFTKWPDHLTQYNLIWFLASSKKHAKVRKTAGIFGCKDLVDQLMCTKNNTESAGREITELVHKHIRNGWINRRITETATYRRFGDNRGQLTLQLEGCTDHLEWSLMRPFDESVLLWHIATDICFFHGGATSLTQHYSSTPLVAAGTCRTT